MSESNEGTPHGSLGTRARILLGSTVLIAGLWMVYGVGVRSTDARPQPSQPVVSDTFRIVKLLCAHYATTPDSMPFDSATRISRAKYRADCVARASGIAQFSSPDLIDIHWTIPEYHDYQQLRDGPVPADPNKPGATTFGPTAYAYAVPQIAGYQFMHQIEEQSPLGALVAYIVVDDPGAIGLPDSYRRINLSVGVNCVWLAHESGATANSKWHGYVAPAGAQNKCEHTGTLPPLLDVHRTSPSSKIDDYPAAVRFGEGTVPDGGGAGSLVQPLLGVRCLDGWCEIGPPSFSDGLDVPPEAFGGMLGRERKIKGWYDDQWLSDDVTHKPRLRAVMIARPNLDKWSASDFNTPRHVATMYLFDSPPPGSSYAQWGLKRGGNDLYLTSTPSGWNSYLGKPGSPGSRKWFVNRTAHYDEAVPGTARFHWSNSPNAGWTACGAACCEEKGSDS